MKFLFLCLLSYQYCLAGTLFPNLVFSDDFDELDLSIWQHEITLSGGGNWEFEYYTNNRSNSYVRDSILYILPTLTSETIGPENVVNGYTMDLWGGTPPDYCTANMDFGCSRTSGGGGNVLNPIQSASVRTVNSFSFKYGRVEISAKLPRGDWIWPALWMLPTYNSYGDWPVSGEIDIVESRGNVDYPPGGVNQMSSTLHWGPFWSEDDYSLTHSNYTLDNGDFSDNFHTFGFIWTNETMYTYVDTPDQQVLNVDMSSMSFWQRGGWENSTYNNPWLGRGLNAPFDQKFYFVFNLAVGGTDGYFPDGIGNKPWSNNDPNAIDAFYKAEDEWYSTWKGENSALQIDYIRVFQ